jgi:hypothetical protein
VVTGKEIADAVDAIIDTLDPKDFPTREAINWGDLGVVLVSKVEIIYPEEEPSGFEVLIEEADPSSIRFCAEIADIFLYRYGFRIDVRTEW